MSNIILLFICLFIGLFLQRNKSLPKDAHVAINLVILHVPLPALVLLNIPLIHFDFNLIPLVVVPWFIFFFAYLLMPLLGRKMGWNKETVGCLILTAGLGNTAFVGFPILEALYGKDVLKYAVFLDQLGTFLLLSFFGIWVATKYSAGSLRFSDLLKRILLFPPFVAFVVAIICNLLNWKASGMTKDILTALAATLTPLALVSVGLQLKVKEMGSEVKPLLIGLTFKLIVVPMIVFIVYRMLNLPQILFNVSVLEAAMAPMITGAIIASSYSLNARLAGLMVGIGVPVSFLTVFLWFLLLG